MSHNTMVMDTVLTERPAERMPADEPLLLSLIHI